jgi:hypothetical protein
MKALDNIYGYGSQSCCLKGKTYRDTQLRELVHFIMVEHALEHGVSYRSEPTGEKCGEGETAAG